MIAVACALAAGGWVCEGKDANRCPGALTCDVDVATVCCPYGSAVWCDGCASSCSDTFVACNDESQVVDCDFSATIDSLTCGDPVSTQGGVEYTLTAKGTITSCGEETILFRASNGTGDQLSCGSWDVGVYGGCVAPPDNHAVTTWTFTQKVAGGTGMGAVLTPLQLERAHGSGPALATGNVLCGPQ